MTWAKYVFFIILTCWFQGVMPADAATYRLLEPRPEVAGRVSGNGTAQAETPPRYQKRGGRVGFMGNLAALRQEIRTGDVLELAFFAGEPLLVEVTSFSDNGNGTFTVSGRRLGEEIATFTMTFDAKSLVMTLQDIEKQTVYRLVGDLAQGGGEVVEVDQTKLPARRATPPRIPGTKAGGKP